MNKNVPLVLLSVKILIVDINKDRMWLVTIFLQHAHVPENLQDLLNKKHPSSFGDPALILQHHQDLDLPYQNCRYKDILEDKRCLTM
jgi:hypothetical protein